MAAAPERILLVDDDTVFLEILLPQLREHFNVEIAYSGEEGLVSLRSFGTFAVILSDFDMPGMNGIEFLSNARNIVPNSVRIMLTGQANLERAIESVNRGEIFRFLTKPCPFSHLKQVLSDGLNQYRLITAEKELLEQTLSGSIRLLIELMTQTYPAVTGRSRRIQRLARALATRIGYHNLWEVDIAALLSHIGCVTLPNDTVLRWLNGENLSQEEQQIMLRHPEIGKELLANIPRLQNIAEAIEYQAKHFDGSGLPKDGCKGRSINLIARILAVAIDFERVLACGADRTKAYNVLQHHGTWYDPDILAALHAELINLEQGYVIKEIPLSELKVGMILADELCNTSGHVIIPRRHEISKVEHLRLSNLAVLDTIAEPIRILHSL